MDAKRTVTLILVTITLFINSSNALAQKVNNQQFYLIGTNGLTQIIINQDTITSKKSVDDHPFFVEAQSLVVKAVKKDGYEFIISKPLNYYHYKEADKKEKFNLICFQYKNPDHYVHLISENTLYYSMSECDTAIDNYDPDSKIYFTCFTPGELDKFKTYSDLLSLPEDEQKDIYIKLISAWMRNKTRVLNTHIGLYGLATVKELASRVLIENKINPLISEYRFDEFLKKYM